MAIGNAVNGPEAAPYIAKAGGTMTGSLILNTNLPTTDLQAASKGCVDAVAQFCSSDRWKWCARIMGCYRIL